MKPQLLAFDRLLTIMDELREKCPWDRKQTMESLRYLSIEELYELSDAILEGDDEEIKKELGDIMLHMVFYAKIASEKGKFDIADVLNGICDKLIIRHPHIYGDVKAYRMQEKAKGVGFEWSNSEDVWKKVQEELEEFKVEATKENNHEKLENEFGDLIFSLINYARFIGVNPEDALEKTNKKFKKRFQYLEIKAGENGQQLQDMTLDEMDVYWEEAKKL